MNNRFRLRALSIGLVVLALLGGFFYLRSSNPFNQRAEVTSDLIGTRLEESSDLITTKYYYHNTASFENTREFYGWKVPFTSKRFLVSYDGIIHAGIPLAHTEITVTDDEIQITLPPAEILAHGIEEDSTQVLDEKSSVFNEIVLDDFIAFSDDQKKETEKKAIDKGLLIEAKANAEKGIFELLNFSQDIQENYQIVFK